MSKSLEFYYDVGSPASYLAYKRLLQLETHYDLTVHYKPFLLGGVFKATGNASPATIPAKGRYMSHYDLPRFARRYGVAFAMNPHFPINTLALMRGAIAAEKLRCGRAYRDSVFEAIWVEGVNMAEPAIVAKTLRDAGINSDALLGLIEDPAIKQALITATEDAVARGLFGAPTMFMNGEMYFGQDRLDFIEEALTAARAL